MNYTIQIDKSRCVSCGICRRECQQHIPVYRGAKPESNAVDCIGCLHCYAVRPKNAITVAGYEDPIESRATNDAFPELTNLRRICRKYAEKQIDSSDAV